MPQEKLTIPLATWFYGPMPDCVENLLNKNRLRQEVCLNLPPICKAWQHCLQGKADYSTSLCVGGDVPSLAG